MDGKTHNGMQCIEFEALLADALDGTLEAPRMAVFQAHAAGCPDCGPLFAQAQAGLSWMKSLPEVEPPRHLVHNILAATTGREVAEKRAAVRRNWQQQLSDWIRPVLVPAWATIRQPRFAMSFAMAFFSLSLILNVTGLKLRDLRHLDLRPSALERSATRGYYESQAKVVRYYENMRLVYELQSRVRDLRNATRPEEPPQAQPKKDNRLHNRENDTSGQPEPRDRQYRAEQPGVLLAVLRIPNSIQLSSELEAGDAALPASTPAVADFRRGA